MPKVSVIIPTYNRSDLVKEAVDSVLQQSFTDFEILVIDDGSADDTRSVIKCISDIRIKYFHKSNGGLSSARNMGLVNAKGEYVALLDDDDMWPAEYLQTMLRKLEQNPQFGMAYSLFKDVYPDGREAEGFGGERYLSGWLTKNFYDRMPCLLPSTTFFRKSALEGFFFDEALKKTEDIDAFLRLSLKVQLLCVPEISVIRRKTIDGITSQVSEEICPNIILLLERFYFHLGGDKVVPAKMAKRKISREYRGLARKHYQKGHRQAAILLFKKAISYYPFDPQYYRGLFRAMLLSKENDRLPHWQIPKPLPTCITSFGKKIEAV